MADDFDQSGPYVQDDVTHWNEEWSDDANYGDIWDEQWLWNIQGLIRHMIRASGKTAAEISREIGKTSGYLSVVLADGRIPRVNLLIAIANACGYTVKLEGLGTLGHESILLDNYDNQSPYAMLEEILPNYPRQ